MSFDLDDALTGLCAEHAAGVAAALPRDHGEAMHALFDTITGDLPDASQGPVRARRIAHTLVTCQVTPEGAQVGLSGALQDHRAADTLVGLARNTQALIARARQGNSP
jgi:hypothetical protein